MGKSDSKARILVTGGSGQIGTELKKIKTSNNIQYLFPSSKELDIRKKDSINSFFKNQHLDLILNLAAYTKVDDAENNKRLANDINNKGARFLSVKADKINLGIIHFSTDYVFGNKPVGIKKPNDEKFPMNYYGLTKSLGEQAVLSSNKLSLVIRMASVFGNTGENFVKTMMSLILNNTEVKVVSDQKISMTSASDVAKNIPYLIELYRKKVLTKNSNNRIMHFANKGYTNWFSVAKLIYQEIESYSGIALKTKLLPIKSSEWKSKAKRSLDSRLKVNYKELERERIILSSWGKSVSVLVRELLPKMTKETKNG